MSDILYAGVVLLTLALGMLTLAAIAAGASPQTTGAVFLRENTSARSVAMGGAGVGGADDVYGMHLNPAGIAAARRRQIGFLYENRGLDMSGNYLGYLHPTGMGALALSLRYVSLGSVDRTLVQGGLPVAAGSASAADWSLGLIYARRFGHMDLGLTAKVLRERLDDMEATAVAFDGGAKWRVPGIQELTVGASLSNLGSSLKFVREEEALPLVVRSGATYRQHDGKWSVSADLDWTLGAGMDGHVGGDYWIMRDRLAFRAGINTLGDGGRGLTAGMAVRFDGLDLDYAYMSRGIVGDRHMVSLGYSFGAETNRPTADRNASSTQASLNNAYAIAIGDFTMQADDPAYRWLGAGAMVAMAKAAERGGHLSGQRAGAMDILVSGECRQAGELLVVTAHAATPDGRKTVHASGNPAEPFKVWDRVIAELNLELAPYGITMRWFSSR